MAQPTFCNPLNLDYRFNITDNDGSYREAADPQVFLFQDDYYIFSSHSGGYWWSPDFENWTFVEPTGINIEKYAPGVWAIGNTLYYTSSESNDIYKTNDPKGGAWTYVSHPFNWQDPWVFVDDDGKVYAYHGLSQRGQIECVQLDPNNKFATIGQSKLLIQNDPANRGFEVFGDNNEEDPNRTWTEGSSVFKHNGTYYLTYAVPGTEKRSYCDGYYTSDSPMGPFVFGANSPATRKSLGYVTGTGHGGFFFDKAGELWTIFNVNISTQAFFERRLGVFPADIDANGQLHSYATLGDYPLYLPAATASDVRPDALGPKWNVLSYGKQAEVSSSLSASQTAAALDEDMRTYWSAQSGAANEWFLVDLGSECTVNAVQANFYDAESDYHSGKTQRFSIKYVVEYSTDKAQWTGLIDKSTSTQDTPHDYVQLTAAVTARYLRITNKGPMPGNGHFSLNDFRVFGNANGSAPAAVASASVALQTDQRVAQVSWQASQDAEGYLIMYGIEADKLWNHYQVWNATEWEIRSLIADQPYYFRVDAYNASGVTQGTQLLSTGTSSTPNLANTAAPKNLYVRQIGGQAVLHGTQPGDLVSVYNSAGQCLTSFTAMATSEALQVKHAGALIVKVMRGQEVHSLVCQTAF